MKGNQCDNCRKFQSGDCIGWLEVHKTVAATGTTIMGTPRTSKVETEGSFCCARCAADYLCAQVLIGDGG